jgi:hypothetical protein
MAVGLIESKELPVKVVLVPESDTRHSVTSNEHRSSGRRTEKCMVGL